MLKLQEEPVHKYQIQKDNIKTNGKHKQTCYVKIAQGRRNQSRYKSTNEKDRTTVPQSVTKLPSCTNASLIFKGDRNMSQERTVEKICEESNANL